MRAEGELVVDALAATFAFNLSPESETAVSKLFKMLGETMNGGDIDGKLFSCGVLVVKTAVFFADFLVNLIDKVFCFLYLCGYFGNACEILCFFDSGFSRL